MFADKLAQCCSNSIHPHVSADGYNPYQTAIPAAFAHRVDHGMLIKRFGGPSQDGQRRYSPATIIGVKNYQNAGTSKPGHLRTSRIERSTLTIPLHNRRWARLTNAFGKSWENHELMFALFITWYNLCRAICRSARRLPLRLGWLQSRGQWSDCFRCRRGLLWRVNI